MTLRRVALALVCVVGLSGCLNVIAPPGVAPLRYRDTVFPQVTVTSDIVYGSAKDQQGVTRTLRLDLYEPVGDTAPARPVVVWVHGGGFVGGTKIASEIVDQATVLSKRGYVNVSIDYRLGPKDCNTASDSVCSASIQQAQYDAQAAVRWVRANATTYRFDTTRVAIAGSSAGAITALNVAANAQDVGTSGNPGPSSAVRAAVSLSGARVRGIASSDDAPSLLFHGTADPEVLYDWALTTQLTSLAAGVLSIVTAWEGDGHLPYGRHRTQIISETTNFLYWELDLTHAAQ